MIALIGFVAVLFAFCVLQQLFINELKGHIKNTNSDLEELSRTVEKNYWIVAELADRLGYSYVNRNTKGWEKR